jgi:hypothetical protein
MFSCAEQASREGTKKTQLQCAVLMDMMDSSNLDRTIVAGETAGVPATSRETIQMLAVRLKADRCHHGQYVRANKG